MEYIALLFLWAGVFFCFTGIVGLVRFRDVYSRIHASGKVSTVGLLGLLIGTAMLHPETAFKIIALALFVLITSPVASHAIAAAAYRLGVPMHEPVRDDLAERRKKEAES